MSNEESHPIEHAVEIEQRRERLWFEIEAFLRSRGWKHTSKTPGSHWMWELEHSGSVLLADTDAAVHIEQCLEIERRNAADRLCDECNWFGDTPADDVRPRCGEPLLR